MRLNVGGQQSIGRFPSGWTCVDILPGADHICDISTTQLPFGNQTVDAIYCSHVLEHIWEWRQDFVMSEFFRVMKSQALLRIVVPDIDIAVNEYIRIRECGDPKSAAGCFGWWFNPTLDNEGGLHLNHVFGFNWSSMKAQVARTGFINIERSQYNRGRSIFSGCDNPGHEPTSLYLEAFKP